MTEEEAPVPPQMEPELAAAMASFMHNMPPPGPNVYANGFTVGASWSDVGCVLMLNGQHVANLNLSFTTAKTLAQELVRVLSELEEKTGHTIMTMGDVRDRTGGGDG